MVAIRIVSTTGIRISSVLAVRIVLATGIRIVSVVAIRIVLVVAIDKVHRLHRLQPAEVGPGP